MPQHPYSAIFPDRDEPILVLTLQRKQGKIPKGEYAFLEMYCTDRGCDCRRVTIFVINRKMETKAVISMGFDPQEPMAGPFLDDSHRQSPYAGELLQHFVSMVNEQPESLAMLQRHYRQVRKEVEGKPYRGRPFPKPGTVVRRATEPPDLSDTFHDLLSACATGDPKPDSKRRTSRSRKGSKPLLASFLDRYQACQETERFADHSELQSELRACLLDNDDFGEELARLLVETCATSVDERIDANLRLLFDALEILRVELERRRPGSEERMERLQSALARHIILESGDADLCAAVSHTLLQSRVEPLPVLHDANSRRMMMVAEEADAGEMPGELSLQGLFESIGEMAGDSPFEALEGMLQLMALGPAEMQTTLCAAMLEAESPLIRDTALLMILHPTAEVRLGVSRLLADHAGKITPEGLRRLIICRNWFPEEMRADIDAAIATARRSRIPCAPLPRSLDAVIHASPVDGAAAQSFQAIVPHDSGFLSCSILIKKGVGVADAFVLPLPTKRELNDFLAMMGREGSFIESSADYLDLRLCHALAEGSALGKAPNHRLAHIAEILGKDQWKGVPFDPLRELESLRRELEEKDPRQLEEKTRLRALKASGAWCRKHTFAHSWYEDDADVDAVIEACFGSAPPAGRHRDEDIIDALFSQILERRRSAWLDRLTLCALWLRSSPKPPLPWHQMYHVAAAVADAELELARIPLMETIAGHTLGSYLARLADKQR
jgi:hypothetical protein